LPNLGSSKDILIPGWEKICKVPLVATLYKC